MKKGDSQAPDAIFGQSRAFALSDSSVNPDVIKYLGNVRQEALRTNAISIKNQMALQKRTRHKSSMYDDEDEETTKNHVVPPFLTRLHDNGELWVRWFNSVRSVVLTNAYEFEGYDDETLDLLLFYLKNYLGEMPCKSSKVLKIISVLDQYTFPEKIKDKDQELEIDEEWARDILVGLEKININSFEDVKKVITEADTHELNGYNQWYKYIVSNEPLHTMFCGKITSKQLWVLVKYMSNTWVKEIYKRGTNYRRLQDWLFYLLLHTPEKLTAEYTSTLRDLGKKCRELIQKKPVQVCNDDKVILPMEVKKLDLEIPSAMENLTIFELAICVIAFNYGQKDLLD
ncbi:brr1p [Saccharomyces arboricola H-6]|uniref:Brr1p n=1 Tax=Saccharomyces arboricola (strain H-6 / AS 2.3317 / CBS 10644) TaxID=1160507 RepID=J8LH21_SACAR|nr:brr1p [Saccharomyces arboricola H-6]